MTDDTLLSGMEAPSLTNWELEPSVFDLKEDLRMAEGPQAEAVAAIDHWMDYFKVRGVANKAAKNKGTDRSSIQPKTARKQAEWRYPSLSEPFVSTENVFTVEPVTHEDIYAARQNQLLLNNQFNTKIDKVAFFDEYVRTAVEEGTVILRVGWESEEIEVEEETPVYEFFEPTPADIVTLQEASNLKSTDPVKFKAIVPANIKRSLERALNTGLLGMARKVGTEVTTVKKTVKNQPTLDICDYRSVFTDPTCKGNLDKAEFIIYKYETSLDALEKLGNYENLEYVKTGGSNFDPEYDSSTSHLNFKDRPRQKVTLWEYWGNWDKDGKGSTTPIVASWIGGVMVRLEENPYPDRKPPFVLVQYMPVRNSSYGEPDTELLADNQDIIGATTRGMIDLMARSANGQTGIAQNALDEVNKRKYKRGEDFEFNPQVNPAMHFYMHKFPEIPNAAPLMLQHQNSEAESLTGVKAFSSGLASQSLGDVASGIRGVLDAASKRELGLLRRLGAGMVKVGRKFTAMNGEFLSPREVVRVTDDEFVQVRRDDLAGNFDLKLTISSAEEDAQKAEELSFMLQTTGQTLGVEFTKVILEEIAILRKMPSLAKKIQEWQPQPDPLVQQKQKLENLLLEAKIQAAYAAAEENKANADLDRAKAITEQAKAINLQSGTDRQNLDFVEQESGVKQERELQKASAQAKANMALKVVEKALNSKPGTNTGSDSQ